MKKLLYGVFALVLFGMTANAAVETSIVEKKSQGSPSDPTDKKNRANSGTDYYVDLRNGGLDMFIENDSRLNMPSSQFYKLKSEELSEMGKPLSASEIEAVLRNGEYVYMTNDEYVARFGSKPINYAIYENSGTVAVDYHYDGGETILVITPHQYPGVYSPLIKSGCINYQGGFAYEPTGDNDEEDYSLPPTAGVTQTTGDVTQTVTNEIPATNEYGTYIAEQNNYYGSEVGGYEGYGGSEEPSLYWGLGASWDQQGGFSFDGSIGNYPDYDGYGAGGYGGYGGYGGSSSCCGGFSDYNSCGGGFNDYTTNNYYYGDYNSNNNSGDISYVNSFNHPIKNIKNTIIYNNGDDGPVDDDGLPTNTGGTDDLSGDDLPGNTAGTDSDPEGVPGRKANPGFKKDYKKSDATGGEVTFAENKDKVGGVKSNNYVVAKTKTGTAKDQNEIFALAQEKKIDQTGSNKGYQIKSQQNKNPETKEFKKVDNKKSYETQGKPKSKEQIVREQKTLNQKSKDANVDQNYDKPTKTYQEKKSTNASKASGSGVKKAPAPKSKSTTMNKGDGAKYKSNSSAKKSNGTSYKKPTTRNSGGNGQNYSNKGNGNRQNGNQKPGSPNSGSSSRKVGGR